MLVERSDSCRLEKGGMIDEVTLLHKAGVSRTDDLGFSND